MKKIIGKSNFCLLLFIDSILIASGYYLSYLIRFDFKIPMQSLILLNRTVFIIILFKLLMFYSFRAYNVIWRHIGMVDLFNTVKANFLSSIIIISGFLISGNENFSIGALIIDALISIVFIGGTRASIRLTLLFIHKKGFFDHQVIHDSQKQIIIIGAGDSGEKILREIRDNPRLNYEVIGFIDDDPKKLKNKIHGISVIGGIEKLKGIAENSILDEVIIAIPSATGRQMRRIIDFCNQSSVKYRSIPILEDIIRGKVEINRLRKIKYEDILGRKPVLLETNLLEAYIQNKKILITGAGGSIGLELSKQVCFFNPSCLILCDNTENNLFYAEIQLKQMFPNIDIHPVLSDIKNMHQMEKIFQTYKPQVVFHTAAYKHVPILESNPWEGVQNNTVGTANILALAKKIKADRFVMVSTDKAVNPCNVMGATKRVAEMLTQSYAENSNFTRFITVRFGNVVGSNGSVIPIFMQQIEKGGPVTVTHPDITRYFMTIKEASQLILQAGAMGAGGEIFILKMGTPIRIVDMANDLIRLSGLKPNTDIEIKFTGLRSGEKLFEELITDGEGIIKTSHKKIMVLNGQIGNRKELNRHIEELVQYAIAFDSENIKKKLSEIIPEYTPYEDYLNKNGHKL